VGVGLREQRRRGAPLHIEDAGGLYSMQKPESLGLVLRAGVDGEEEDASRAVLLLQRVGGGGEHVAERAVRAELHRVGVAAEVARAQIHPQICRRLQRAAAAAATKECPKSFHNFSGRGKIVQTFSTTRRSDIKPILITIRGQAN
jgi:hypothetical protein